MGARTRAVLGAQHWCRPSGGAETRDRSRPEEVRAPAAGCPCSVLCDLRRHSTASMKSVFKTRRASS